MSDPASPLQDRGNDPVIARAEDLAWDALEAAMGGDWRKAIDAVNTISRETGGPGAGHALICWCDWNIALQRRLQGLPDFPEPGGVVQPGWVDAGTGRVSRNAADVPPRERWAGQLLAARAAMDADGFSALASAMPGDGIERARYASALLESCALLGRLYRERVS